MRGRVFPLHYLIFSFRKTSVFGWDPSGAYKIGVSVIFQLSGAHH